MHEKAPLLSAQTREKIGSRYCRRYREKGLLPAVVYGHGEQPTPICVTMRDAIAMINKGEKVFRLDFPGSKHKDEMQMVLLKDLQFDYLGTNIVHADFERVSLTDRVRTRIHIVIRGEAKGLKTAGAILMHPTSEVEVETTVVELPDSIEVRVDDLDVGHGITAGDIKLPFPNMKMLTDSHAMIAQIVIQQEVKVGEATAAGAEAAQPEVITAKKPAEGEAAAGAKPGAAKDAKPAGGDKKK